MRHEPTSSGSRATHAPLTWKRVDPERAYAAWQRQFIRQLARHLPDVSQYQLLATAHTWAHQFDEIEPEEAADISAMWWYSPVRASRLS
jgi:hypothetical protein